MRVVRRLPFVPLPCEFLIDRLTKLTLRTAVVHALNMNRDYFIKISLQRHLYNYYLL